MLIGIDWDKNHSVGCADGLGSISKHWTIKVMFENVGQVLLGLRRVLSAAYWVLQSFKTALQ